MKSVLLLLMFMGIISSVNAQIIPVVIRDEVVVTASRIPTYFEQTNRSIFVLSRSDIEMIPVTSVQELLEYSAGVDIQPRGPNGVQADINMRGSSFEQTLILVDGIKVSDPQTGHHNMNIPLSVPDIERIEIMKGHGSRLYGPNALGGVINIITRKEKSKSTNISLTGGEFGLFEGSLSVSYPLLNSAQRLTMSHDRGDGYQKASEFDVTSISYGSTVPIGTGDLNISAGYQDKEFGASTFYSDQYPNEWEHTTAFFSTIKGDFSIGQASFFPVVHYRKHKDDFVLDNDRPDWVRSDHTTDVYGAEFLSTFTTNLGNFSIGGEVNNEKIESNGLGNHERNKFGIFTEHQLELTDRIGLTWGAFAYKYSDWKWQLWPGVDIGYQMNPHVKFYSTFGGSFRTPSYTELYTDNSANRGNPDLGSEKAYSYEAGSVITGTGYRSTFTLFHREGHDLIDWVRADPTEPWTSMNITDLNTSGIEIGFEMFLTSYFARSPVKRLMLSYSWIESDKDITEYESKYVMKHLRHQALMNIDHVLPFGIKQNWRISYKDRANADDYLVVDTQISRKFNSVELDLSATNIFDTDYKEIGSVVMPGRWIKMGLKLSFN